MPGSSQSLQSSQSSHPEAPSILVVDDEPQITKAISHRLQREGFTVVTAADGEQALERFAAVHPDLVVLDLMLPRLDGFEVCRQIRLQSRTPVLVLSARGDELDKVIGFRMGADDYMTKPFSPSELVLRIQAILRRTGRGGEGTTGTGTTGATGVGELDGSFQDEHRWGDERQAQEPADPGAAPLRYGPLLIDRDRRLVLLGEAEVPLTAMEFELLWCLASRPETVFTREQLLYRLWKDETQGDPSNVTVLVSRLREKLEPNPRDPAFIKTVWGVGYKFVPPRPRPQAAGAEG